MPGCHILINYISFSGFAGDSIIKVLQGQRIGTLFHQNAHLLAPSQDISAREMAVAARESSRRLQVFYFLPANFLLFAFPSSRHQSTFIAW